MVRQYFHRNIHRGFDYHDKFTACFEISDFSYTDLTWKLLSQETITVFMGVAFCSPEDNFNKRIGRETANQKIEKATFTISGLAHSEGTLYIYCLNDHWLLKLEYVKGVMYVKELKKVSDIFNLDC